MEVPLYFYLAYRDMDRLSPGSVDTTLKLLDKLDLDRDGDLNILDIACGKGSSSILLAKYFNASTVEAFDLFKHYIDELNVKISENKLDDRVFGYCMDMKDPDFANEEFDIVFCEASVEIMGFKRALREWKRMLKDNAYMIVSDVSWLKKPSWESEKFWRDTYPEVDTIENKISQIRDMGYEFADYVCVPKEDWLSYFKKLEKNLNVLNSDESARIFAGQLRKEIEIYTKNSDDYTYVFYIMKRR